MLMCFLPLPIFFIDCRRDQAYYAYYITNYIYSIEKKVNEFRSVTKHTRMHVVIISVPSKRRSVRIKTNPIKPNNNKE